MSKRNSEMDVQHHRIAMKSYLFLDNLNEIDIECMIVSGVGMHFQLFSKQQ